MKKAIGVLRTFCRYKRKEVVTLSLLGGIKLAYARTGVIYCDVASKSKDC